MGKNVLIIGAGPAGLAAAEAAAALGADVTLCGAENYPPYWRPRLTGYLSAPIEAEKLAIRKPEWYAQRSIQLLTGKAVERINPALRNVLYKNGSEAPVEAVVLAMGSSANMPAIPGAENALALRSLDDAEKIRTMALASGRAVVIGGGLLGLETAWELNAAGVKTSLIERSPWLLPRQLNQEGGLYLQRRLETSGISLQVGQDPAQASALFQGACVILAAGVHANLEVLTGSGIATNRAIVVDDHMRTNIEGIFACGDVAEFMGRSWGLMSVAQEQGRVAGANAAGGDSIYVETPPSPMLKVGSASVFSVGDVSMGDGVTALSQENDAGYVCLMLKEDVLIGAVLIGSTAAGMKLKKAVGEKKLFAGISSVKDALIVL